MNEFERAQGGVHRINVMFQAFDLRRDDAQCPGSAIAALRRAEIGAEIEQIVLYQGQHRVGRLVRLWVGGDMEPRQADRGIGLIDGAERLDPQRLFRDPAAVTERRLAAIATARVDPGQPHHRRDQPPDQLRPTSIINSARSSSASP